jgi:hypothetical protein
VVCQLFLSTIASAMDVHVPASPTGCEQPLIMPDGDDPAGESTHRHCLHCGGSLPLSMSSRFPTAPALPPEHRRIASSIEPGDPSWFSTGPERPPKLRLPD